MRALVIQTEPRWAAVIKNLLKAGTNIVPCTPDTLYRNAALAAAADVMFVCGAEVDQEFVSIVARIRSLTAAPIFAVCDTVAPQWREELIIGGALEVFVFPPRAKLFEVALDRALAKPGSNGARSPSQVDRAGSAPANDGSAEVLALLRDLSRSMMHAVDGPLFLDAYLRKLREVLRCGRLVLYLASGHTPRRPMSCAFVTGADPDTFSALQLSRDEGAGRLAEQRVTVLQRRRLREDYEPEAIACRELDIFGAELCVPLIARDGLLGVLFIGERISGTDYTEAEITMIFHLMEELAAMIRAQALHNDLLRERQLFSSVLRALPIGCAVINGELQIVHANLNMRELLRVSAGDVPKFEHLPQAWATAVYSVVQDRQPDANAEVNHLAERGVRTLRLRVTRLPGDAGIEGKAVLLTVEDITLEKRAEHANTTVIMRSLMERAGEQLSNEFRNALTPMSTLLQIWPVERDDVAELSGALNAGMHRLRRRVDELAYLARESLIPESTSVAAVLRSARERFDGFVEPEIRSLVHWPMDVRDQPMTVDSKAIGLAIAELLLNAVEASAEFPVELVLESDTVDFHLRIRNHGSWRPVIESGGFGRRPFVSEKATGVGIGLEVATTVAENHGGKLTLHPTPDQQIEAHLRIPYRLPQTTHTK